MTWREWGLAEWNERAFDHFFLAGSDDSPPVTRIVVTPEELRRIAGAPDARAEEVRDVFRDVIRTRLRSQGKLLCRDACDLEWCGPPHPIPRYFAHLVLTCLAASDVGDGAKKVERNFRRRLRELLDQGDDYNYTLKELPDLWEKLQIWLRKAREQGECYRDLILPNPGRLRIIGYSVELAFPHYKDQSTLIEIFAERGVALSPPVLTVLEPVEKNSGRFTAQFQEAFHEFRGAFLGRQPDLYRYPFWSAVCEALQRSWERQASAPGGMALHALVRLDLDEEERFELTIQLDGNELGSECAGLCTEPAGEFGIERFTHLLTVDPNHLVGESAGGLLLKGRLGELLANLRAPELSRAVSEGVLLFAPDDEGTWVVTFARPEAGEVRALVRCDIVPRFLEALRSVGARPRATESSYPGWSGILKFSGVDLAVAPFESAGLARVGCLRDVVTVPRVHLRGGIILPNSTGWLGRRPCLPEVVAPPDEIVVIQRLDLGPGSRSPTVELSAEPEEPACRRLPGPPQLPEDLDGPYLLRIRGPSGVRATRRVEFRSGVVGQEYQGPEFPERWLGEGGVSDIGEAGPKGRTPADVSRSAVDAPAAIDAAPLWANSPDLDRDDSQTGTLTEILAGLALRRRWIGEGDLLGWFRTTLGVKGRLLWDVVRAWVEVGCLDCWTYRRRRQRCYFARRPRLVAFRTGSGPGVTAMLQGLVPEALHRQVERAADEVGMAVRWRATLSPWMPASLVVHGGPREVLERLSDRARLDPPEWLLPLESLVSPVEAIASARTELLRNHVPAGTWDWTEARFGDRRPAAPDDVTIRWFRRDDAPDAFLVERGEEVLWHTRSRTWAILVAMLHRGERPFVARSPSSLGRARPNGAHLPLPIGRWSSVAGPTLPGPVEAAGGRHDYIYALPNQHTRDRFLEVLWPTRVAGAIRHRARWLLTMLRAREGRDATPLVPMPRPARRAFLDGQSYPELTALADLALVPCSLLPHIVALAESLRRSR
jgi:hypothetical protein